MTKDDLFFQPMKRGKRIEYKGKFDKYECYTNSIVKDMSKFAIINLREESLEDLVYRLEKEAKEAIKRRIGSVYTDYLNILPPYKEADLTLNIKALEGVELDVDKWKRLISEQGLNFVSTQQDVLVIDTFGNEIYEKLSNEVVEFIKSSAGVEYKNGQTHYEINNKIYICKNE